MSTPKDLLLIDAGDQPLQVLTGRLKRLGFRVIPVKTPEAAGEAARAGFDTYVDHCGKCHRMRGVGGELGPELDRPASLSSLLPTEQLRVYVRHDEHDFPQSKMPDFARILSPAQIDQLVAYLQAMQPAR